MGIPLDLQDSEREGDDQSDLLVHLQPKTPQVRNRHHEDDNVSDHVQHPHRAIRRGLVPAVSVLEIEEPVVREGDADEEGD